MENKAKKITGVMALCNEIPGIKPEQVRRWCASAGMPHKRAKWSYVFDVEKVLQWLTENNKINPEV